MTTDLTQDTIRTVYTAMQKALQQAFTATEKVVELKAILEAAQDAVLLDGRIDGKNEAIREAQMRWLVKDELLDVELAERAARRAKTTLELARLDVECVRVHLKLAEVLRAEVTGI